MSSVLFIVLIIIGVVAIVWLYKILKPYFIKHDSTMAFVGGLGSGKTLESVKLSIVLIRKQRFYKYYCYQFFQIKIGNGIRKLINKHRAKKRAKKQTYKKADLELKKSRRKPMLYSNIPICFKTHLFGRKKEWAVMLEASELMCLKQIREYSVVMIDELPQFINQFNWNEELIQKNVNEMITFFRHYVGGYWICNCQSADDIVVQIRRKLNQATWCFDFKKWCFGLFYTNRMCDIMLSDQVSTMSTTFIEDNTKLHFGLFPPKNTYDTRCYSVRYLNIHKPAEIRPPRWANLKTTKVLRLMEYKSPLDDTTTPLQKEQMWEKGEKIWKN